MNKYKALLKVKSFTMIPQNVKDFSITVTLDKTPLLLKLRSNYIGENLDAVYSNELEIDAVIESFDLSTAISYIYSISKRIIDQISFVSGMPVNDMKIIKIIDITDGVEMRQYVHFFYHKLDKVSANELNLNKFKKIVKAFDAIDTKRRPRIDRAIHWYGKAISEEEPLDRLVYIWTSFETLNPFFQDIYNAHEVSKCPNCGYESVNKTTASIKNFFEKEIRNTEIYSKARKYRNSLLHGFEDLDKITFMYEKIEEKLLIALIQAIQFVLKIDNIIDMSDLIHTEPIVISSNFLLGDYMAETEFEPNVELDLEINLEKEELVIKPTFNINFARFSIGGYEWDIYGYPGYNLKKQQMKVIDKS